jgi:putative NIF3 family GTP cyclohydrolase 1 type 2
LPLDLHPTLGNNARLAAVLGLVSSGGFGRFRSIEVGLSGQADISTVDLFDRIRAFAEPLGTHVVATAVDLSRRTKSWGIISGAGASSATLQEAAERGLDTLIVGEGPHHTAVEARERGLAVVYAGHYATETLGVQALGDELARGFSLPWSFLHIPTGL